MNRMGLSLFILLSACKGLSTPSQAANPALGSNHQSPANLPSLRKKLLAPEGLSALRKVDGQILLSLGPSSEGYDGLYISYLPSEFDLKDKNPCQATSPLVVPKFFTGEIQFEFEGSDKAEKLFVCRFRHSFGSWGGAPKLEVSEPLLVPIAEAEPVLPATP